MPTRLFVYGTLMDPACQRSVTKHAFPARPARLAGWSRVTPTRGYPYLVPDPTAVVDGLLLDGLLASDWRALDAYEDAGNLYLRRTVDVVAGDVTETCEVYVGNLPRIPRHWR